MNKDPLYTKVEKKGGVCFNLLMPTQIFYDAEFTGLHQSTTLISLALSADDGHEFYAEFTDFNREQCDDWINDNVLSLTLWLNKPDTLPFIKQADDLTLCFGDSAFIKEALLNWLSDYDNVEIWADCLAWDWVLFCELFGGAFGLPRQIFYMPNDLVMLFKCKGLEADTPRLEFAKQHGAVFEEGQLHNALFDARLAKVCYSFLNNL